MKGIDLVADQVAHQLGVSQLPWYKSSYYGMIIYGALTALVLFNRPDFINVIPPSFSALCGSCWYFDSSQ